jgi:hypothetical protein
MYFGYFCIVVLCQDLIAWTLQLLIIECKINGHNQLNLNVENQSLLY